MSQGSGTDTVPLPPENSEQRLIFSWDCRPVRA
jgi:hypothetical protein